MDQKPNWHPTDVMANVYERDLVPTIFGPWAATLIARANPRLGEEILDIACGTGAVTRLVAQAAGPTGRVVGMDVNQAMLDVARSVPTSVAIEWREGRAEALPFQDQTFDLVLCQQGLQFFPDRPGALAEMRRILRPTGRVALSVWRSLDHSPAFVALSAALSRHVGTHAGVLPPFAMGDADEASILAAAAGFHEVIDEIVALTLRFASPEEFVRRYILGSPLSVTLAGTDAATYSALVDDVSTALRSYVDAEGLACPVAARLVTARK